MKSRLVACRATAQLAASAFPGLSWQDWLESERACIQTAPASQAQSSQRRVRNREKRQSPNHWVTKP